jgi:hypothetical protein
MSRETGLQNDPPPREATAGRRMTNVEGITNDAVASAVLGRVAQTVQIVSWERMAREEEEVLDRRNVGRLQ